MRRQLPELDKGLGSLLVDLADRGLLQSTIVWCGGEFGRTPRCNGRPPGEVAVTTIGAVFSTLVAGGGFKGGQLVGASDARGEEVKDRPVYPCDLIGTMYQLLGINPQAKLPNPEGADLPVVANKSEGVTSAAAQRTRLARLDATRKLSLSGRDATPAVA